MNELEDLLARAADRLPDAPDRLAMVQQRRHRLVRRRRLLVGCTAVAVLGAAVGAAVALRPGSDGGEPADSLAQASPSGAAEGQLYEGIGRVVAVPGRPVRFCAPVPTTLVLIIPRPAPAYCDFGVDVVGVDLDALSQRREAEGAVEGQARLTGTLEDGVLHVLTQGAPTSLADGTLPTYGFVPCPAPAGGWPRGAKGENLDAAALQAYQAQHPAEVSEVAMLRPSQDQVVAYLLTSGDVSAAQDALHPTYGARLCVGVSRYTPAQVAAAQTDPAFKGGAATQVYAFGGTGLGPDAQVTVEVSATLLTPELEAAVAKHPKGLVRLDLFLKPVGGAP